MRGENGCKTRSRCVQTTRRRGKGGIASAWSRSCPGSSIEHGISAGTRAGCRRAAPGPASQSGERGVVSEIVSSTCGRGGDDRIAASRRADRAARWHREPRPGWAPDANRADPRRRDPRSLPEPASLHQRSRDLPDRARRHGALGICVGAAPYGGAHDRLRGRDGIGCSMVEELAGIRAGGGLLARSSAAETSQFETAFGVPVRFSADIFAVVIKTDHLRLPVRSRDRDLRAILQRQVAAYWALDQPSVAEQVRRNLAARITARAAAATSVATDIGMSVQDDEPPVGGRRRDISRSRGRGTLQRKPAPDARDGPDR